MGVTLHWHAHPIRNLVFSAAGLLFSGGEEGTVVTWTPGSARPSFIPRVCSVIVGLCVSADGSRLFVAGKDNAIRFVETTQRTIQATITGLALAGSVSLYHLESAARFGIVFDPRSQQLLLNTTSHLGQLQLYDPARDAGAGLLGDSRTDVSKTWWKDKKGSFRVDFARLSANGEWLFVAQRWADAEGAELSLLLVWKRQPSGEWELFASVESPHRALITAMAAHPRRNELATADRSGLVKVWELVEVGSERDNNEAVSADRRHTWSCTYQSNLCEEAVRSLAYSQDGSVLAVAHNQTVSLFDSTSREGLVVLPCPSSLTPVDPLPPSHAQIKTIAFFQNSSLLLCVTECHFFVWDTVARQIVWMVAAPVACAAANSDLFAEKSLFAVAVRSAAPPAPMEVETVETVETSAKEAAKPSKSKKSKKESKKSEKESKSQKASSGSQAGKDAKEAPQPAEPIAARASREADAVLIFDPSSSVPVVSVKLTTKVLAMTWGRESIQEGRRMCLYCLTERGEVVKFVEGEAEKVPVRSQETKRASAFDEVFEVDKVEELASEMRVKENYSRGAEEL